MILYGIIGLFSSSLDFGVFTLFVKIFGIYYIIANSISVLVGITTSFLLNRKYNFKVTDQPIKRFVIFLTVGLIGLLFSNLILYCLIQYFDVKELIAKIASIVLVVLFQFLVNKYITFTKEL